jgi:hypothetical protein
VVYCTYALKTLNIETIFQQIQWIWESSFNCLSIMPNLYFKIFSLSLDTIPSKPWLKLFAYPGLRNTHRTVHNLLNSIKDTYWK